MAKNSLVETGEQEIEVCEGSQDKRSREVGFFPSLKWASGLNHNSQISRSTADLYSYVFYINV